MNNKKKVTIFGAGMVGATSAYSLVANQTVNEIALVDINKKLARAQVMDLQHSISFSGYTKIKVGNYSDIKNSDIVIITCGAAQKEGETRLDLIEKNSKIIKEILPKVFKQNQNAVVVIVTNPVDVLTYQAIKLFPSKKKQIFGTGTILDSARFRFLLSEKLNINPSSIHAYIVGEHGDSELPLWSAVTIGNAGVEKFELSNSDKENIFNQAKNAAYAIIEGKQSTYYAIASGVEKVVDCIINNKKTVLPVSHLIENKYGIKDVCLSLPAIIGSEGIIQTIDLDITKAEKLLLKKSAKVLKKYNK
jgi:L-lactate dehydrogenase